MFFSALKIKLPNKYKLCSCRYFLHTQGKGINPKLPMFYDITYLAYGLVPSIYFSVDLEKVEY